MLTEDEEPEILDATVFCLRTCPTLKVQICQFSLVPIIPGPMELHRGNIPFPFSLSLPLLYFCLTIKNAPLTALYPMNYFAKSPLGRGDSALQHGTNFRR